MAKITQVVSDGPEHVTLHRCNLGFRPSELVIGREARVGAADDLVKLLG